VAVNFSTGKGFLSSSKTLSTLKLFTLLDMSIVIVFYFLLSQMNNFAQRLFSHFFYSKQRIKQEKSHAILVSVI